MVDVHRDRSEARVDREGDQRERVRPAGTTDDDGRGKIGDGDAATAAVFGERVTLWGYVSGRFRSGVT